MGNELTQITAGELAGIIQKNGIGEIIKPLVREIYLFDTYISGTALLDDPSVLESIEGGERLSFLRKDSIFDDFEIAVYNENGKKAGLIPEKDNAVLARLMDAGKMLFAKVISKEMQGSLPVIKIGVYLEDF